MAGVGEGEEWKRCQQKLENIFIQCTNDRGAYCFRYVHQFVFQQILTYPETFWHISQAKHFELASNLTTSGWHFISQTNLVLCSGREYQTQSIWRTRDGGNSCLLVYFLIYWAQLIEEKRKKSGCKHEKVQSAAFILFCRIFLSLTTKCVCGGGLLSHFYFDIINYTRLFINIKVAACHRRGCNLVCVKLHCRSQYIVPLYTIWWLEGSWR